MTRARSIQVARRLATGLALGLTPLAVAAMLAWLASCAGPSTQPGVANVPTAAVNTQPGISFTPAELDIIYTLSPLPPVPSDPTNAVADRPAAAQLGQYLFFDARLSGNGRVSCATCHDPARNWTDGQSVPENFNGGLRNVPSLWNVAYNRWFFWDGRADTLWSQGLEPLENPTEHGGNRLQYARLIREDRSLRQAYENVFGPMPDVGPLPSPAANSPDTPAVTLVYANMGKAMAAYERRIVTRRAPFDVFVEGLRAGDRARTQAISPAAQRGLKLFIGAANCRSCHHGPNFTDGEFHDTGISTLSPPPTPDPGRFDGINRLLTNPFNAMGAFNDDPPGRRVRPTAYLVNMLEFRGQFKTPTLRNVAVTAPYMHRGQLETLDDVVRFYSTFSPPPSTPAPSAGTSQPPLILPAHRHGAGSGVEQVLAPLNLSQNEINDLVAFLESLTNVEIDPALTKQPASPVYTAPAHSP